MTTYIGLDVHSKFTHYCIQDDQGETLGTGQFETSPEGIASFVEEFKIPPGTKTGLETGTTSFFVSLLLALHGLTPIVIDAHEVRKKAHRKYQKSDSRDAEEICHGIRTDMYRSIVHVPPKTISLVREALRRRRFFVRSKSKQIVAAKSLLRAAGIKIAATQLKTEEAWTKLIEKLKEYPELQGFVESHRDMYNSATQQIEKTERQLLELGTPFQEDIVRLQSVPGVGPIVALTTIAALSDVERFPSPKHVASYAGLVPRMAQSGDMNRQGHITKAGNPELRSMLCEAAHHASKKNNPFNPLFSRVCAKKGYRVAVIAVAHKILRILWSMLKHKTEFSLEPLGLEKGHFVTKNVKTYRLRKVSA